MKLEIYTEERTEFNDFVIKVTEYDEGSLRIDGKFLSEHDKQIRMEVISEISREMRLLYGNEYEQKIRADAIDEVIEALTDSMPLVENQDIIYGFSCAIERAEQLKDQKEMKCKNRKKCDFYRVFGYCIIEIGDRCRKYKEQNNASR